MFEYDRLADRLALDVRDLRNRQHDVSPVNESAHMSPLCGSLTQSLSSDVFDCGSSSGYGSPGTTPLASPHEVTDVSVLPVHVRRALNDAGLITSDEYLSSTRGGSQFNTPAMPSIVPDKKKENAGPAPMEDGLSNEDIADFETLLCSPKKQPPTKYQCHICYQTGHYISDCPTRFNSAYDELTPYQGRKKCYGEFQCQQCKRKWTSQNSVANEAQSCIKCHIPVFPHKQLPVEKAVTLGLIKAQKVLPTKLAPIGHGRPPVSNIEK